MDIIKLDATDSTNAYLKEMALRTDLKDDTVVYTQNQRQGKGQQGASWQTETGKNLTFSILKVFNKLPIGRKVWLNCIVPLAILEVLEGMAVPDVKVKWPNDIMSGNKKLCGILIENIVQGTNVKQSILGIGLNVNQTVFPGLPQATSLQLVLGKHVELEPLMVTLVRTISERLIEMERLDWNNLRAAYEKVLYRKDVPTAFEDINEQRFMGLIRTIDQEGRLVIELEDAIFKTYGLKEIKLLG